MYSGVKQMVTLRFKTLIQNGYFQQINKLTKIFNIYNILRDKLLS